MQNRSSPAVTTAQREEDVLRKQFFTLLITSRKIWYSRHGWRLCSLWDRPCKRYILLIVQGELKCMPNVMLHRKKVSSMQAIFYPSIHCSIHLLDGFLGQGHGGNKAGWAHGGHQSLNRPRLTFLQYVLSCSLICHISGHDMQSRRREVNVEYIEFFAHSFPCFQQQQQQQQAAAVF